MIKISHNDSLVDIIEKIQKNEEKEIFLDFPAWHSILHNYISLKILKTKAEWRNITIATNDIIASKIGKKLWMRYTLIKDKDYIEKREVNSWNLMKHNFWFLEYLIFELKKYYKNSINLLRHNKKINSITYYGKKYNKGSGIWFFFIWLILSIWLLVFIFYFAINKTTITITPEIAVKSTVRNFIFIENNNNVLIKNNKDIRIYSIETPLFLKENYTPTEIDHTTSSRSKWKIQITNTLTQEINLISWTRFITSSWVIFETNRWITVPPSITDNLWDKVYWEIIADVIAKDYDMNNSYIGERGNIEKSEELSLPWLTWTDSWSLYAISIEEFRWWKNDFKRRIWKEDITNAKRNLEQKLKNEVTRELNKIVQERNKKDGSQLWILLIKDMIEYSNIKIELLWNTKPWDISESFSLQGSIIGKTYVYDKKEVANKLRTIIKETILEWVESILFIDDGSLKITEVLSRKENPLEIKATVEIDTFISHDFLSKNNNYTEKLKDSIKWLSKENASRLLINDSKISNVLIEIRPFFLKNISNISENIIFKVKDS